MKAQPRRSRSIAQLPKTYRQLMEMHLLRPIHDQADAENAAEMIELLAGHKLNNEQADYLELLSELYEKWEAMQFPIKRARPAALLSLAIEERGHTARDLAQLLRIDVSLAYRLLRGERNLTADQIRKVAKSYALDPAALLG